MLVGICGLFLSIVILTIFHKETFAAPAKSKELTVGRDRLERIRRSLIDKATESKMNIQLKKKLGDTTLDRRRRSLLDDLLDEQEKQLALESLLKNSNDGFYAIQPAVLLVEPEQYNDRDEIIDEMDKLEPLQQEKRSIGKNLLADLENRYNNGDEYVSREFIEEDPEVDALFDAVKRQQIWIDRRQRRNEQLASSGPQESDGRIIYDLLEINGVPGMFIPLDQNKVKRDISGKRSINKKMSLPPIWNDQYDNDILLQRRQKRKK